MTPYTTTNKAGPESAVRGTGDRFGGRFLGVASHSVSPAGRPTLVGGDGGRYGHHSCYL